MSDDAMSTAHQVPTSREVMRLQRPAPIGPLEGHDVCSDLHTSLSLAEAVVRSRQQRVADATSVESSESMLRELRALGVVDPTPQLVAMVAIIETAVGRLADVGATSESDAWEQLHKDVVRRHCQSPDTWPG